MWALLIVVPAPSLHLFPGHLQGSWTSADWGIQPGSARWPICVWWRWSPLEIRIVQPQTIDMVALALATSNRRLW